jgi:hypothetical protein
VSCGAKDKMLVWPGTLRWDVVAQSFLALLDPQVEVLVDWRRAWRILRMAHEALDKVPVVYLPFLSAAFAVIASV